MQFNRRRFIKSSIGAAALAGTGQWYDPPLRFKDGVINVPTGPSLGISDDVDILKNAKAVE